MKKIAIIYGTVETPLQQRAVAELSSVILDDTFAYPACFPYDAEADRSAFRCIYVGTKENNPYIRAHSAAALTHEEGYAITVEKDTVIIEGYDDAGVLYGVCDFYHKYIVRFAHPDNDRYWVNVWERDCLPDFFHTSYPAVRERGLWTWGHVIYDYKGYLDHMVKLKMNRVIIWNDFVPVNARELVAYAHGCGIKVIWGFPWLWGTRCDKVDLRALDGKSEEIFAFYESQYANACGDGIYFQTFTELNTDRIDGVLIAEAAADFVNRTAALFYARYPELEIQFGLHATSVKNRLEFIARVDPRIRIVWENCGAFPFDYIPTKVDNFEETMAFTQRIAVLRGASDRFGAVTKGLVKLDWRNFSHSEGSHTIGVSSRALKENRVARKHRIWKYIQAYWLVNADYVLRAVREMSRLKEGDLLLAALVEDGMFEEQVMFPVALYAEMLWDCRTDVRTMIPEVAMRSYVVFA